MTLETKLELHPTLQAFVKYAPTLKQLFTEEVNITISDREKVLEQLSSKDMNIENLKGRTISNNEPIMDAIRRNKRVEVEIPKESYGEPLKAVIVPIEDNGQVIGTISVSKSTSKQTKLKSVAEQFAASSEEISASTGELASAAIDFNNYMKNLSEAQNEMRKQVENTTKILEIINSVAKNTRILGFNAGIEAARSGEYGRGFSVVAKEITKLADQSADSVNEIRQLLDGLTEKVQQVAVIVKESVEISQNQTTSIEEISKNIEYLSEVAEDIEEMANNI